MRKVSCLICAYNEEGRIGSVLQSISEHPLVNEVLVVDDGSTDGTAEEVKRYKNVQLISLSKNQGKTNALCAGLAAIENEWVLLLDADLVGLGKSEIDALVRPVLERKVAVSISLRKNSLLIYKMLGLDFVSGERVFNKKLLNGFEKEMAQLPRFGFEVFMNERILEQRLPIAIVKWKNVSHVRKAEKIGFWPGQWAEFKMGMDMLKTVGLWKILRQNIKLLRLKY